MTALRRRMLEDMQVRQSLRRDAAGVPAAHCPLRALLRPITRAVLDRRRFGPTSSI